MNGELRKVLLGAGALALAVAGLAGLSFLWFTSHRERAAEAVESNRRKAESVGAPERILERVVQTNAALRAMEQALENYFKNHDGHYPAWTGDASPPTLLTPAPAAPGGPRAELSVLYPDPFARPVGRPLAYFSAVDPKTRAPGWLLWSAGPDGDYDIDWRSYNPDERVLSRQPFAEKIYDPKNGILSDGDIARVKN